jgi:hypothetical protein
MSGLEPNLELVLQTDNDRQTANQKTEYGKCAPSDVSVINLTPESYPVSSVVLWQVKCPPVRR